MIPTKPDELALMHVVYEGDGNINLESLSAWWEARGWPPARLDYILNKWHARGWSRTGFCKLVVYPSGMEVLKSRLESVEEVP